MLLSHRHRSQEGQGGLGPPLFLTPTIVYKDMMPRMLDLQDFASPPTLAIVPTPVYRVPFIAVGLHLGAPFFVYCIAPKFCGKKIVERCKLLNY